MLNAELFEINRYKGFDERISIISEEIELLANAKRLNRKKSE